MFVTLTTEERLLLKLPKYCWPFSWTQCIFWCTPYISMRESPSDIEKNGGYFRKAKDKLLFYHCKLNSISCLLLCGCDWWALENGADSWRTVWPSYRFLLVCSHGTANWYNSMPVPSRSIVGGFCQGGLMNTDALALAVDWLVKSTWVCT